MHYTAGANAESSIRTLTDPERRASAHLVISRSGDVTQLVPFDVVAWHAGPSRWAGLTNLNRYSIGIELDNAGKLTRNGSDWVSEFQRAYPAEEVIEARHKNRTEIRGWHRYTEQQLTVAIQVGGLLVREYGLRDVLGHDDIAPERKTDPGPAFPMASFRSAVLGRADDAPDPDRFTTTTDLNIRTGPGTQHEILKGSPVPPGTTVHILAREGNWARVDVEGAVNGVNDLEGWAHSKYLTPA
jgi:N-acetylmuramoyl-L-alanine amidase